MPASTLPPPSARGPAVRATLIALALLVPPCVWLARSFPSLIFEDDAYFYLQIAWNVATGHGSSFDGLHVTNGYHLLWSGLLVPLAWSCHVLGLGKLGLVAAATATAIVMAVLSVWSAFDDPYERMLGLTFFVLCGLTMESVVLTALLLVAVRALRRELRLTPLSFGVVCALVPLARIDFSFVVPTLALLLGRAEGAASPRPRLALVAVLGTCAGLGIQLGLEQLLFGSWSSVSSAYKTDLARARGGLALLTLNLGSTGNRLRLLALAVLALLAARPARDRAPGAARTALLALGVIMAPVVVHLFLSELRDWYVMASLLLALLLASRGGAPLRLRRATCAGLSLMLLGASAAYLVLMRHDMVRTARFIEEARRVLSPTDRIYQVDGSGFTGFLLNATVVNGDGLVNSWDYRRRLRADALQGYLTELGATHVITNEPTRDRTLVDHHGVRVESGMATLVLDTGETRHPHARFRLYALGTPREPASEGTAHADER